MVTRAASLPAPDAAKTRTEVRRQAVVAALREVIQIIEGETVTA